jgi:nucleolar protein 58
MKLSIRERQKSRYSLWTLILVSSPFIYPGFDSVPKLSPRTGRSISKKLGINITVRPEGSDELWRGIRTQLAALLDGLDPKDLATMSLGLSHSLSR